MLLNSSNFLLFLGCVWLEISVEVKNGEGVDGDVTVTCKKCFNVYTTSESANPTKYLIAFKNSSALKNGI